MKHCVVFIILFCRLCFFTVRSQESPRINPFNFPPNLKIGGRVSVICAVTSGSKPLKIWWEKENKTIKEDEHITIHIHAVESVLRIDPITIDSAGNYACMVSNEFGIAKQNAILEIPVSPSWVLEPKNTDVVVGSNITIQCQANGFPVPTLSWMRKENPFDIQDEKFVKDLRENTGKGSLLIIDAKKEDEGAYECIAKNGVGTVLRKTISVVVRGTKL